MPDYQIIHLKISTLVPVHIGDGGTLLHEYDYAIYNGQTWRINENELLDALYADDPAITARLATVKPAQLLKEADFRQGSQLFRYVLKGTPRSAAEGAQLREQLKDAYDRPYLPGTGLKGALRTALAWYAWGQKKLNPEVRQLDRRREWAAKYYEAEIFGPNPNKSLMRALQVGDSTTVSPEQMMIVNVRVLNRGGGLGSPIEVEALRPDTVFEAQLKLDLALFSDWAKRQNLHLQGEGWLKDLATVAKAHSRQRIQSELAWYQQIPAAKRLAGFYQQLLSSDTGANAFLLQLGWGTGWDSKTFGSRLKANSDFMESTIQTYRLARGRRMRGYPFPNSRRVAVSFTKDAGGRIVETPALPMGWVLVEISEGKDK